MDLSFLNSFEQLQTAVYLLVIVGSIPIGMWAHSVHGALDAIKVNTGKHSTEIAVLKTEINHLNEKVDRLSSVNPINHLPSS